MTMIKSLGDHLKMICDAMNVDIVTGRKQLGDGKR
jgi:hypothetical protein